MARKQKNSAYERDWISKYARSIMYWVAGEGKWLKRSMNKRWRRDRKKDAQEYDY